MKIPNQWACGHLVIFSLIFLFLGGSGEMGEGVCRLLINGTVFLFFFFWGGGGSEGSF